MAALQKTSNIEICTLALPGNFDSLAGYAKSAFAASERFAKSNYDLLLVLGDRYEILAACGAATVAGIPIAHIHGGEVTEGSFDDALRNAITQLSHIHFVATDDSKNRLIRMGEDKTRIYKVGAPGLDNLVPILEEGPRNSEKYFVVTYHPETLGGVPGQADIYALVEALKSFSDYEVYWTGVNNDPGGDAIRERIEESGIGHEVNWPPEGYLRHCRHAACVIGNSSSFIIEAPSLGVPSVDIGDRQKGRQRGPSVMNCRAYTGNIVRTIKWALYYSRSFENPYGQPGASAKIAEILATQSFADILKKKAA